MKIAMYSGNPRISTAAMCLAVAAIVPQQYSGPRWSNTLPASATSAALTQTQAVQYDSKFRKNLKTNTAFWRVLTAVDFSLNAGAFKKMYMYNTFPANLTQSAEGAVGQGETPSVVSIQVQIGEVDDYVTLSSYAAFTAIDDSMANIGTELGYQYALTLSITARNAIDGLNSFDSSVKTLLAATSTSSFTVLDRSNVVAAIQELAGRSVGPPEGRTMFPGVIHPFAKGDAMNNTGAVSWTDVIKRTPEGFKMLQELPSTDIMAVTEMVGTGAEFYESNLVTQYPNYNPGGGAITGLTALSTYLLGYDAVLRCHMNAPGDTAFGEGDWQAVKCFVKKNAEWSISDPSGKIPCWTSYRGHVAVTPPPDATTARARIIIGASGLS